MRDFSSTALLIIDMLNDFVQEGAPLEVPRARKIIEPLRKRVEEARREGVLIFYLCDAHRPDDVEFNSWPPHGIAGTPGAQVVEKLEPQKGDYVIPKRKYSCFLGTDLDLLLRERGIKKLIITGVVTNICVFFTAADAFMRGYEVIIPRDSVAALTEEEGEFSLEQMKSLFQAKII